MSLVAGLPVDAAIGPLAALLDAEAIRSSALAAFADIAPEARFAIEGVRYRPGRNCVLTATAREAGVTHRLVVHAYPPAEAVTRAARSAAAAEAAGHAGAVALDAMRGWVLWRFPFDLKLPSLPAFLAAQPEDAAIISWFPQRACTVRRSRRLAGVPTGEVEYGKLGAPGRAAGTFAVMRDLYRAAAAVHGLELARPLAVEHEGSVLWQAGVTAQTLDDATGGHPRRFPHWVCVGHAVGRFHGLCSALPASTLTLARVADDLAPAAAQVAAVMPAQAAAARRLLAALQAALPALDDTRRAVVHGDLHGRNLLWAEGTARFIDLDRTGMGTPLADLASLLAAQVGHDCVAGRAVDLEVLQAIVDGYRSASPGPVSDAEWRWHTAAALLRERASRAVTRLKPGRLAALPQVLDTALELLAGGGHRQVNAA